MSNSPESIQCSCGETVPSGCVRCRFCGAFLRKDIEQFHESKHETASQWYLEFQGVQKGPFDTQTLKSALQKYNTANVYAWKPGLEGWIEVERIAELMP